MRAIFRRELQSYFITPVAYVFLVVYFSLAGVFFYTGNVVNRSGDLLLLLGNLSVVWILLAPVLTMRLLAGERRAMTDQLLLTSPVSLSGVVLGKFFASCAVMLCAVLGTLPYALVTARYATVYAPELTVGYLGYILQGCAILALDMLMSCFARNQVTASLLSFGANLMMWLCDLIRQSAGSGAVKSVLSFFSLYSRFEPFIYGQLSFASVTYYLSFAFLCLFLTVRVMDARRCGEGLSR